MPADAGSGVPRDANRRRERGPQPVALVGFREWIFSENSGAEQGLFLANWFQTSDLGCQCSTGSASSFFISESLPSLSIYTTESIIHGEHNADRLIHYQSFFTSPFSYDLSDLIACTFVPRNFTLTRS